MPKPTSQTSKAQPIEKQHLDRLDVSLWKAADKLRKNIDAAEYKHIVLGLIFLKYISDAFEDLHSKLKSGAGEYKGADAEDKDEYKAENVFFVPEIARWSYLQSKATLPTIGKVVDNAMDIATKVLTGVVAYRSNTRIAINYNSKTSAAGFFIPNAAW